ncbi:hypothetical protein [Halobacillus litoralis]|uniref:hypothetical protein n=2 Tax=Halobacillus TaxID=45667 RepID=UPI00136AA504|nr:hypothetical protein [Halobacillus litoralis]MYL39197.1 hypothetical protein [Halobacillus litoralis]
MENNSPIIGVYNGYSGAAGVQISIGVKFRRNKRGIGMNKKTILISAIIFAAVTLILNNVLQTAVGGFLMTLSFSAFVVLITGAVYYISKFYINQIHYNQKNRENIK